jgi:UDP-glucose 4-epimerase
MKYLVTGGAGFIGSHLCEELISSGHEIIVADDLSSGFIRNLPNSSKIEFEQCKIQDIPDKKLKYVEGIFHLAAQASVPVSIENFYSSSSNNLISSLKVFEIARKSKIPIVYASSSAIYGNLPLGNDENSLFEILSPYAMDKITLEKYALLCSQLYDISSIGLRFFNVYGARQDPKNPYSGVISIFIDRFINNKSVTINGGYQTRDFIYVKDIVTTLIKSMQIASEKKICDFINVGSGVEITIESLFEKLVCIFGLKPEVIRMPLSVGDPERSKGSYCKLSNVLQINQKTFQSFEEGLKETVNYFKNIQK